VSNRSAGLISISRSFQAATFWRKFSRIRGFCNNEL